MSNIGTAGRVTLIALSIPLGCLLVALGALLLLSQGRPKPFLDDKGKALPNSVSEKIHVSINGAQQGMFIKGKDAGNPVLLFLHGGTAMPEYFLTQNYPTGLDDYFTVCWWDRRGAGLSYSPDIPPATMTLEQSISDTLAVTNYLRNRFHKDKIYLMGHSGGSLIGIQAAARASELYYAYVAALEAAERRKTNIRYSR